MNLPNSLAVSIAWLALACNAHAQSAAFTLAASDILRKGPAHVLAGCDLWQACDSVTLEPSY